jgi:hypothetical protein
MPGQRKGSAIAEPFPFGKQNKQRGDFPFIWSEFTGNYSHSQLWRPVENSVEFFSFCLSRAASQPHVERAAF